MDLLEAFQSTHVALILSCWRDRKEQTFGCKRGQKQLFWDRVLESVHVLASQRREDDDDDDDDESMMMLI